MTYYYQGNENKPVELVYQNEEIALFVRNGNYRNLPIQEFEDNFTEAPIVVSDWVKGRSVINDLLEEIPEGETKLRRLAERIDRIFGRLNPNTLKNKKSK